MVIVGTADEFPHSSRQSLQKGRMLTAITLRMTINDAIFLPLMLQDFLLHGHKREHLL
jgi:hypothetical protein